MKKIYLIRALQIAEVLFMLGVCWLVYKETGKVWVALAAWLLACLSVVYGGMTAVLDLKPRHISTGTVKFTGSDMKQMLTLRLKIARTIAPRLWLCAQVMKVAAAIGGVGIVVDVVNENEVSPIQG